MNQRPWRFAALAPVGAVSLLVVEFARPPGSRFDSTPMPELPTKITLGEMRASGVRRRLGVLRRLQMRARGTHQRGSVAGPCAIVRP